MKETKPVRIQRKRTKGWKLPENTVYVDRTTKWGNPFIVGKHGTQSDCVEAYRKMLLGYFTVGKDLLQEQINCRKYVAANYKNLSGKNLACFCALDKPCHADVLLELANT